MPNIAQNLKPITVAYYCMEVGINSAIKEYAGGLGILAGDTLKTAADMGLNMIGISILYKQGYFKQEFDSEGIQQEIPDTWDYENLLTDTGRVIQIDFPDTKVYAKVWRYDVIGESGHKNPLYFLDTDIEQNNQESRYISYNLYTPFEQTKLRQMVMLGLGGVELLDSFGHQVDVHHLNESHAAFAILGIEHRSSSREEARKSVVFTTHTPAEHGHVKYSQKTLQQNLDGKYLDMLDQDFDSEDNLHMTKFCMANSRYANAVAMRHGQVSSKMFPGFTVDYITNGIHLRTWAAKSTQRMFDRHFPGWRMNPELLNHADKISSVEVREAHSVSKSVLFEYIESNLNIKLDPEVFTIGFARRVDGYKRSGLLFRDLEILKQIASRFKGIQIIMSGKAYYDYAPAENVIAQILANSVKDLGNLKIVYIPDHNMDISSLMVSGCDIWLNNPIKPLEASGTSRMKAALNGLPNFSTIDGWWVEGWEEGVTGWSIGGEDITYSNDSVEAYDIYSKLEHIIMPMYYNDKSSWTKVQLNAISKLANRFSSHRMLSEYITKSYHA